MFMKTLEMLAIHWKIINPNSYRHRLTKIPGISKELIALPKQVRESHYFHLKTLLLSCKNRTFKINETQSMVLNREFYHSASKLQLGLFSLVSLLQKVCTVHKRFERNSSGFFNKLWNNTTDSNPINDYKFQSDLFQKLNDLDQNIRSIEESYILNLKKLASLRKIDNKKRMKIQEEESKHILVKQTHDREYEKMQLNKSAKYSNSIVSTNNVGSQTLTDLVLTTVIRKQTESALSDIENQNTHQRVNTEETVSGNGSFGYNFNYFQRKKNQIAKTRVNSNSNTDELSRLKSSNSIIDKSGNLDTINDERFNRRVRLTHEEDKYYSDEDSDSSVDPEADETSINHIKRIISRDNSNSTAKSYQNFGKKTPNGSGHAFSGLPSNAVIQETLRKQYNNSGISRKDYSKRTRVSVLDSSLSSLYKNSVVGKNSYIDLQNKDPNKVKLILSGESNSPCIHPTAQTALNLNKYKEIGDEFRRRNLNKSELFKKK